jgi:hypothetical protein
MYIVSGISVRDLQNNVYILYRIMIYTLYIVYIGYTYIGYRIYKVRTCAKDVEADSNNCCLSPAVSTPSSLPTVCI